MTQLHIVKDSDLGTQLARNFELRLEDPAGS